ncbi:PD-(D/E)XK nuclease family transposase [Limosilactobacillus ingluviei]
MTTSLAQFQATTRQLWQAWQAKTITSELIFEMVMQNPTLCTELVQRVLPELEVGSLHLVNPQQNVHSALLARAVRYDIYAQDAAGRTFVLEMQVKDEHDLAERIRYYQGMMDQLLLRAGALGPFLDLMAGNVNNKDKFIAQIQAEIKSIKTNQEKWLENMLYELKMQERFDAGEEQGLNTERNRTVQKFIAWSRQRGADQATVVTDLAELYGISKQEAQRYYDQAQLTDSH